MEKEKSLETEHFELLIKTIMQKIEGTTGLRDGLKETAERVVKSWDELYIGYDQDPDSAFKTFKSDGYDEMIVCRGIEFYSTCEHHMLPFYGKIHIGYVPNDRIVGLSKLARLTEIYSRRLQTQERMTNQIANKLMEKLNPLGAGVIIEGKHLCMMSRGIQKQDSVMITSSMLGVFRDNIETRAEFIKFTGG